jgi:hypothetical protein
MLEKANLIIDQAFINFGKELVALALIAVKFGGLYLLGKLIFGKKK